MTAVDATCLACCQRVGGEHLLERLDDGRLLLWCYADKAGVRLATDVTEDPKFQAAS